MKLFALVVTYNRKESLALCLRRLEKQKRKLSRIVIIDNHSTDGTTELLESYKDRCTIIKMDENVGGAGAYNFGFNWCVKNGADWIWCVEDDILAPADFTEKVAHWIEALPKQSHVGFLYPTVLSIGDRRVIDGGIHLTSPAKREGDAYTITKAQFAGSIINCEGIKAVGLPVKEFFIYFDDWEFTSRMKKANWEGYWLSFVYVWHNSPQKPYSIPYLNGRKEEMWKFYYGIRNELSTEKKEKPGYYVRALIRNVLFTPLVILLLRRSDRVSVAFNWAKWSLKSLVFNYRPENID